MQQLFQGYSIQEMIIFIIILALGIKNLINFIDWARKRTRQAVANVDKPNKLQETTNKHEQQLSEIREQLRNLKQSILLLTESDKDDIKHAITKDHHYFCYKLKSIDDYSLDCIQRRYSHYKDEGGNSFVESLMQDLRALPRKLEENNR